MLLHDFLHLKIRSNAVAMTKMINPRHVDLHRNALSSMAIVGLTCQGQLSYSLLQPLKHQLAISLAIWLLWA